MLSIDLKALGGMESHRGIGYMMLVSSVFAPSFLSLSFLRPELVEDHLVLGVLMAASVGLLCTAGITAAIFMSVLNPDGVTPRMKRLGARSLGVGAAMSLATQVLALAIQLMGRIDGFGAYVGYVGVFSSLQVVTVLAMGYREHRKHLRERRPLPSNDGGNALE